MDGQSEVTLDHGDDVHHSCGFFILVFGCWFHLNEETDKRDFHVKG